ncbi:GspE/PulE family protein [Lachnospiraceae bacterium SGI.231]
MALRRERMRLGDILIKQNVLTEEQLKQALELQKGSGKKIGEVLVDSGMITEEMIVRALQMQLGLKVVHLSGVVIPKEVRNLVSVSLLKKYRCIPFELDPYNANILHLAMADPMDMTAIDDISIVTNLQVEPYIATTREVLTAIDRCYGASETMDAARRFIRERALLRGTAEDEGETDVSDAPIVQLVRSLIEQAIRQRASDIHIEALEEKVRVRYRIDGALYEKMVYDNSLLPAIATRIKIMGDMDISEKRKPQDGRMSIEVDRQEYDIRISSIPTVHGEKLVLRLSSKLNLTRSKKELGLSDAEMEIFDHMLAHSYGIIFVTGPTGSGKSATLASLVDIMNRKYPYHIITLEDPIEYLHRHQYSMVNQREIGSDSNDYAQALRAALREDPDVILVGEMRDLETISTALTAAETGHLVLSTLHTIGADKTIDRIIDVFPPNQQQQVRIQLASVLECIISQQLIRREDGRGRVAALEVLFANTAIRNMIRENKTYQIISTMQTGKRQGMQTMDDAIYELFLRGDISADSAVSYAQDPVNMSSKVNFDML